jgi:hypothetical protein
LIDGTCFLPCTNDSEGNPTILIPSTRQCITQPYSGTVSAEDLVSAQTFPNSHPHKAAILDNRTFRRYWPQGGQIGGGFDLVDLYFDSHSYAWTLDGNQGSHFKLQISHNTPIKSTGYLAYSATWRTLSGTTSYLTLKNAGRARRLLKFAAPTQAMAAVNRVLQDRSIVPKTSISKVSSAVETPIGFNSVPVQVGVNTVNRFFQQCLNWAGTTDPDFRTNSANPQFIVGRYLAETLNFTGTMTAIGQLAAIPAAESVECPSGYTRTTVSGQVQCIFTIPSGSELLGTDTSRYYNSCPDGYSVIPGEPTKCRANACPSGFLDESGTCRENCSGVNGVTYEADSTKCATDCSRSRTIDGHRYETDPDAVHKCVTARKNTPGMTYTKVVWWWHRAFYTWVRDQYRMNNPRIRDRQGTILSDYYIGRPSWAPADIRYDLYWELQNWLTRHSFDSAGKNFFDSEYATGELRHLHYFDRQILKTRATTQKVERARTSVPIVNYTVSPS